MRSAGNVATMPGHEDGGTLVHSTSLVEPGTYLLQFVRHETVRQFRSAKLILYFRVVTAGPALGAILCRYYAVQSVATKSRRKGGSFQFGQKCDFFREYCRVLGPPSRPDRITPVNYRNSVVTGEVVTVTMGHDQLEIPDGARYSKVARLLSLEAGKR